MKIEDIPDYHYSETMNRSISVESIYNGHVSIPHGHEFVAFRPPRYREAFLMAPSGQLAECGKDCGDTMPRIIVKLVPKPKRYVIEQISAVEYSELNRVGAKRVFSVLGSFTEVPELRFKVVEEVKY